MMKLYVCMECGWHTVADEWHHSCGNDDCVERRVVEVTDAYDKLAAAAVKYLRETQGVTGPLSREDVDVILECGIDE